MITLRPEHQLRCVTAQSAAVERFRITMATNYRPLTLRRPRLSSGRREGCLLGKLQQYFGIVLLVACLLQGGAAWAATDLGGFVNCDILLQSETFPVEPVAMTADDFNSDGAPDLALVDPANSQVIVLLTDRAQFREGNCQQATTASTVEIGDGAAAIASGDIDKNGTTDLVVAEQAGVAILRGSGSGSFIAEVPLTAGTDPRAVAIADVDGDGEPDIVVGSGSGNSITVLYGRATGGFDTSAPIAVNGPVAFMIVEDFNNDGFLDIAAGSYVSGSISILLQLRTAPRSFRPLISFAVGVAPTALGSEDFNNDGTMDLAVTSGGTSGALDVYLNTILEDGQVSFAPVSQPSPAPVLLNPSALASDDFNRDSNYDAVVANQGNGVITFFLGDGTGVMTGFFNACGLPGADLTPCAAIGEPAAMVVADVDGDGRTDVITANQNPGSITVLLSSRPEATPTPTNTPTPTATDTPTATPTATPTPTTTPTPTATPTPTSTNTPRPTFTPTITPTAGPTCYGSVCVSGSGCGIGGPAAGSWPRAWWLFGAALLWFLRRRPE